MPSGSEQAPTLPVTRRHAAGKGGAKTTGDNLEPREVGPLPANDDQAQVLQTLLASAFGD
jgi:hypothetical protein